MTIWRLIDPIEQPDLTSAIIQPNFELINKEKTDLISSLRSLTFETKETPTSGETQQQS